MYTRTISEFGKRFITMRLPSHQSIIEWYKGTGLRPYLEQLSESDGEEFLKDVFENVQSTYPIQENDEIIFRFPRLFFYRRKITFEFKNGCLKAHSR